MKEILAGKIQGHYSLSFSCFATSVSWLLSALVVKSGMILNSDEEAQ
jgi:hypothetical protein